MKSLDAKLSPFQLLDEPMLSFAPGAGPDVDIHPLKGLLRFGPYSTDVLATYTPELRVVLIGPAGGQAQVVSLLRNLHGQQPATGTAGYVPDFPGFERVFKIALKSTHKAHYIAWPEQLGAMNGEGREQDKLVHAFQDALARLDLIREQFDVAVVHIPDHWLAVSNSDTFNAHDVFKAMGARAGIPTQVLNDRVFTYARSAPAAVAWRISIALYVKAGGIPWKLAPMAGVPEGTAYIGLAYALRTVNDKAHFVTCCSQVFDMDGGGMQFVAFEARDPVNDAAAARHNPFLSRADMRAVMARSLALYRQRNGGALPTRLVVHKTTPFSTDELSGLRDATSGVVEVECMSVGEQAGWRGVWMIRDQYGAKSSAKPVKPDGYPVPRGVLQAKSETSFLLWVAGNAPSASSKGGYFQGGKGIPRPLLVTRQAGSGDFGLIGQEILALTKMDWNNDALYDPVPVTIGYSRRLARAIANVPDLPGTSYPYRLFM